MTNTFWKQIAMTSQYILAIIVVMEFPPRLSFSSQVSTESL